VLLFFLLYSLGLAVVIVCTEHTHSTDISYWNRWYSIVISDWTQSCWTRFCCTGVLHWNNFCCTDISYWNWSYCTAISFWTRPYSTDVSYWNHS
jgi:hypothetical protein